MEGNDHHPQEKLFDFLKLKTVKMLLNYKWTKNNGK